jgi:ABC-2 type transport system permease protein
MLIFTAVGVFYVGFWLALAMLFSLLFQKTVTAALASMAVWLFMTLFVVIISQGIAGIIVPDPSTPEQLARRADVENIVSRISPSTLFSESVSICSTRRPGFRLGLAKPSRGHLAHSTGAWPEPQPHLASYHDPVRPSGSLLRHLLYHFMRAEIRA